MFRNRMAEVRPMLRVARHLTNLALAATLSAGFISRPEPAMAGSAGTIIVGNDRGGFIRSRLAELRRIRANH